MTTSHELQRFAGRWTGGGKGHYPTVEPFEYVEEVELQPVPGKPLLAYVSRTRAAGDGRPLHGESGFWRMLPGDGVEVVVAHGFGAVEVLEGEVAAGALRLATTGVALTTTAKRIEAVSRTYRLDGDVVSYDISMAAVGVPMTHHLSATLRRAG